MKKIAIVTDTDSSMPSELANQNDIRLVPITVHFGEESFTTGVDIDDNLLFKKVDQLKKLPTTSAPSTGSFSQAFQEAFDHGADSIICICVSSIISSTYNSALTAREMFPDKQIYVVDSLNLCMGQAFMALKAAEAARQGADEEEIIANILKLNERLYTIGYLTTLKYIAMSGRVGKLAAGMADTFNIKPIMTSQNGKLEVLERVRTQKNASLRIIELTAQFLKGRAIERTAIFHANNLEGALTLEKQIRAIMPFPETYIMAEFTPGLSVHTGAGVVGIVTLAAE